MKTFENNCSPGNLKTGHTAGARALTFACYPRYDRGTHVHADTKKAISRETNGKNGKQTGRRSVAQTQKSNLAYGVRK